MLFLFLFVFCLVRIERAHYVGVLAETRDVGRRTE